MPSPALRLCVLWAGLGLLPGCGAPAEGPAAVVWNKQACAQCRMLVGEPAFAAQLHTHEGEVLHFDDPGCLLLYEAEKKPAVASRWFHHMREERWIAASDSVLVRSPGPTPMGYGLGAVERGPGVDGFELDAARALLSRDRAGRGSY